MLEEDTGRLNKFIFNVRKDIDLVVRNIDIIIPEQEQLHGLVMRAWEDINPRFEEISLYLVGDRPLEGLQKRLNDRGLTGIQLEFKLSVYETLRDKFLSRWDKLLSATRDKKDEWRTFRRRLTLLKDAIVRLFDMVDIILDSLGFMPGAHVVMEFKAALETLLW